MSLKYISILYVCVLFAGCAPIGEPSCPATNSKAVFECGVLIGTVLMPELIPDWCKTLAKDFRP